MTSLYAIKKPVRLGTEVYEALLKQIMSLHLEPGERISIDGLARQFGVSQTPIREALNQLEAQGLVVKVHLSGYRVAPQLTHRQFDDLCELRMLIEPAAAAKAARLMPDAELQEIVRLAQTMTEPTVGDPQSAYNAFARDDAKFHVLIAKASRNELFHEVITRQRAPLHLFRLRFFAAVTQHAIVEHGWIVDALQRRDPEAAADAMRAHITNAHCRFKDVYRGD